MIREGIAESRSSIAQETARILDDVIANAVALTGPMLQAPVWA
jgi:hypothetical protein